MFGFNGMEKDNEQSGLGNTYTTEFRQLDVRLGRWFSVDRKSSSAPGWTPFRSNFNNPIIYTDPTGLFETRWEDENGGLIDITPDGQTKTVRVPSASEVLVRHNLDAAYCHWLNDPDGNWTSATWNNDLIARSGSVTMLPEPKMVNSPVGPIFMAGTIPITPSPSRQLKGKPFFAASKPFEVSFFVGATLDLAEIQFFDSETRTWMGKDLKVRSLNVNGNATTGGKYSFARKFSRGLNYAGWGLGAVGFFDIEMQYRTGQISNTRRIADQGSNAIQTFTGMYGLAWGVGWESGRAIASDPWYRANVRPYLQDALGVKRDEYPSQLGCEVCDYIKKRGY
ncbi:MAG TPA: hypothetical protein DIW47_08575 [Bacteroidetes bacterium]|nr:hypothetical protein [Bacteroidota bacterium]